jgi:hypothetical protein
MHAIRFLFFLLCFFSLSVLFHYFFLTLFVFTVALLFFLEGGPVPGYTKRQGALLFVFDKLNFKMSENLTLSIVQFYYPYSTLL